MLDINTVPAVPNIAPVQSAAGQIATSSDIGSLLGPIAARASAPLPDPYTQGVQVATPHVQPVPQYQPKDDNRQPIANTSVDIKRARHQNAMAGLANVVGKAGQAIQERKQAKLKDQLTDVMKAKQNVANATAVASDPNASVQQKQLAAKVLEANKKQLNDILSDPKTQKQMAKALDISFVDSEKNKTPEVKAYQEAMKEFKSAGPFNSDNPQEHAVAQIANGQGQSQTQQPNQQPAQQTQVQPKSATPYADKALSKDMPTIEANPQYAAAVKQQQDAQKQLAAIVPHLIQAESKAQIQAMADGNKAVRAQYEAVTKAAREMTGIVAKAKLADSNNKSAMARVAARNANEIATTTLRVNASLKIAEDNRLSKEQQFKIKQDSLDDVNKKLAVVSTTLSKDEANIEAARAKDATPEVIQTLEIQRDIDLQSKSYLQNLVTQKFSDITPSVESEGLINAGSSGAGAGSERVESVGNSESDEDDDSDDYGNN